MNHCPYLYDAGMGYFNKWMAKTNRHFWFLKYVEDQHNTKPWTDYY